MKTYEEIENDELIKKVLNKELKISTKTAEQYVRKEFPIKEGECHVKYCHVGNDNFRINFFKEKGTSQFVKDYTICRSYYVQMKKDNKTWRHEILDSDLYLS